jgi:hypothetical protein
MRRLICASLLVLTAGAAAAEPPEVLCSACRDVYEEPRDFGNHAFNLVFGDNPVFGLAEGDKIRVWNDESQSALVDLNFVIESGGLAIDLVVVSFTFAYPTGTIQIRVQDPRGHMTEYEVFAASSDLLVGAEGSTATEPKPEPDPSLLEDFDLAAHTKLSPDTYVYRYLGYEGIYDWYVEYPEIWRSIE